MASDWWGRGWREVRLFREEILSRLEAGYSVQNVFDNLAESEKITVGIKTFRREVAALRREGAASASTSRPVFGSRSGPSVPSPVSARRFVHNPSPSEDDVAALWDAPVSSAAEGK